MSSINRLNLFLLAIILVLAALRFLPEESEYYPLTSIPAENIHAITISSPQRELVFQRDDKQWVLNSVPGRAIEEASIEKLLGILKTHSYRQFEMTPDNLAAFGLDRPAYRLKLDELVILFGTTDPVQNLRYVALNDRIHMINDLYLQFFLADEKFFLEKGDINN